MRAQTVCLVGVHLNLSPNGRSPDQLRSCAIQPPANLLAPRLAALDHRLLKVLTVSPLRPARPLVRHTLATVGALLLVAGCSDTPTVEGDAPESVQRDALESTWDKASESQRRSQCAAYQSDPIGAIAEFEDSFDYDVVKGWLEAKC